MDGESLLVAEIGDAGDGYARIAIKDGQTGRPLRPRKVPWAELRGLRLAEDLGSSGLERAFGGVRGLERGGELTRWLFGDSDGQRELVRGVMGERLGASDPNVLTLVGTRLEIRSAEPTVLAQPWQLLAWQGLRLIDHGWSVVLTPPHVEPTEGVVPASPLILIVAPAKAPQHIDDVGAGRHVAELTAFFRTLGLPGKCVRVVTSLVEIEAACEQTARWDIVYFYGHGHADGAGASLVLADGFGGEEKVPLVDLEAVIRAANPAIVLLNACRAGASGWYGAGHRLCAAGRVVLSHLCTIEATAAAERGLGFFRRLLLDGADPVASFTTEARGGAPSGTAWMAGTIHAGARSWRIEGSRSVSRQEDSERWALGLDRSTQRGSVMTGVHNDLVRSKLRGIAFVAQGGPDNLVELFGRQAYDFLCDDEMLHAGRLPLVRVDVAIPPQPTLTEQPWTEHLLAALGGRAEDRLKDAVGAYLRSERSIPDGRALLWLNFGRPRIEEGVLRRFLHSWLEVCRTWTEQLQGIDPLRLAFVLGLEISPDYRARVTKELDSKEVRKKFNRPPFEYRQLDELAPLRSDQDIVEFLGRSESVELSEQAMEWVAESIYVASLVPGTNGLASYRKCVECLNKGCAEGWEKLLAELGVPAAKAAAGEEW